MPPKKKSKFSSREFRSRDNNLLYGESARQLKPGYLPTNKDVDLAIEEEIIRASIKQNFEAPARNAVLDCIISCWTSVTNIQIMDRKSIQKKLEMLRKKREIVVKNNSIDKRRGEARCALKNKRRKGRKPRKTDDFKSFSNELFDISKCVPESDMAFYLDQKGPRKERRQAFVGNGSGDVSSIGGGNVGGDGGGNGGGDVSGNVGGDVSGNGAVEPIEQSEPSMDENSVSLLPGPSQAESESESEELSDEIDEDNEKDDDPDYKVPDYTPKGKKLNPALFDLADRFNVSNQACTGFNNILQPDNSYTSSGLYKARQRAREAASVRDFSSENIFAVGFDERKDHTFRGNGVREEHCSVVFYSPSGDHHAGFFTPENGTGKALAEGLYKFCVSRKLNFSNVTALVTDGTYKMTGHNKGAHKFFEELVGRKLQRIVCYLHHLEKLFEHIFLHYGGLTLGPGTLTSYWDALINGDVHEREINKDFKVMPNEWLLGMIDGMALGRNLSNDHAQFLALAKIVITGNITEAAFRRIGPFNNARFTTTESRILRAYISLVNPHDIVQRMVHFLVYVWAGSFLNGKMFPAHHFVGPKLLFLEVLLIKTNCRPTETAVLQNAININGQFIHSENVILHLLHSQDETERRLGVQTILRIRDEHPSSVGNLRSFAPIDHRVNMRALSLSDLNLVPLKAAVHEPPVTERMSRDEVISFLDSPMDSLYPITSVSVERAIKDTTAVSMMATSEAQRNGALQLRIRSRLAEKAKK